MLVGVKFLSVCIVYVQIFHENYLMDFNDTKSSCHISTAELQERLILHL